MRKAFIIISVLLLSQFPVFGQDTLLAVVTTPKGHSGRISDPRKIVYNGKLDLDFYNKFFHVPFDYPKKFIDTRYKDETIVVWRDSTKTIDFNANWSREITYDSSSRVISYRYNPCVICSQLPYEYHFSYNQKGQMTKMKDIFSEEAIKFKFDDTGNIVYLKVQNGSKLVKEIQIQN